MSTPPPAPEGLVLGLVDDAAVFPPGDAPLPLAVQRHRRHGAAWYARFTGPLLTRAAEATELADLLSPDERLPVVVVVRPGTDPHLLPAAVEVLHAEARAEVRGVELPLADATRLEPVLPEGIRVWLEVPADDDGTALDAVAAHHARAKLRTGGLAATDFPDEGQVAAFVVGCIQREVTFKLTAGLHHAVRHTDSGTGFEHHGVANVLAATWAGTEGAQVDDVAQLLAERDPSRLVDLLTRLDREAVARTRSRFASFGCCEVTDPLTELADLSLLTGLISTPVPPDREEPA